MVLQILFRARFTRRVAIPNRCRPFRSLDWEWREAGLEGKTKQPAYSETALGIRRVETAGNEKRSVVKISVGV